MAVGDAVGDPASRSLDEQLVRHLQFRQVGREPPPALKIAAIAQRYGIEEHEIKLRLKQLYPPLRDA